MVPFPYVTQYNDYNEFNKMIVITIFAKTYSQTTELGIPTNPITDWKIRIKHTVASMSQIVEDHIIFQHTPNNAS